MMLVELRLRNTKYMELPENDQDILHAEVQEVDDKGVRVSDHRRPSNFQYHICHHMFLSSMEH